MVVSRNTYGINPAPCSQSSGHGVYGGGGGGMGGGSEGASGGGGGGGDVGPSAAERQNWMAIIQALNNIIPVHAVIGWDNGQGAVLPVGFAIANGVDNAVALGGTGINLTNGSFSHLKWHASTAGTTAGATTTVVDAGHTPTGTNAQAGAHTAGGTVGAGSSHTHAYSGTTDTGGLNSGSTVYLTDAHTITAESSHTHPFLGASIPSHTHTWTGDAVSGHSHSFTPTSTTLIPIQRLATTS
jgi:hypothetical protein